MVVVGGVVVVAVDGVVVVVIVVDVVVVDRPDITVMVDWALKINYLFMYTIIAMYSLSFSLILPPHPLNPL